MALISDAVCTRKLEALLVNHMDLVICNDYDVYVCMHKAITSPYGLTHTPPRDLGFVNPLTPVRSKHTFKNIRNIYGNGHTINAIDTRIVWCVTNECSKHVVRHVLLDDTYISGYISYTISYAVLPNMLYLFICI